jgi:hypothetical protein
MTGDDVMKAPEVARLLRISSSTVYAAASCRARGWAGRSASVAALSRRSCTTGERRPAGDATASRPSSVRSTTLWWRGSRGRVADGVERDAERGVHGDNRGGVDLAVQVAVRRLELGVPEDVSHGHQRHGAREH